MKIIVKPILFLCVALTLCSCKKNNETEKSRNTIVHVAKATKVPAINHKEFSFIAKPFRVSELSFRVNGPIDRFQVYAGNYYKHGSIIAEIDPRDFHIRKEKAEAVYNQSKAEYERIKTLYEKNNVSASTYEKAKADYTSAKAAYNTAVNELNDTKLIAPFNGYVGEVYIEQYQDVKATQPIISFLDIEQLKIETYVTQDIAFNSHELKNINLIFDAIPDKIYEAKIIEVSKSTTSNNLSYLLTALLPNKDMNLLSGMSGKVFFDLNTSDKNTLAIPQIALSHRPSIGDYVWVIDMQTKQVSQRPVRIGKLQKDGTISILEGLKENETVATSGLRFLSDGTIVEISQE